MHAHVYDFHIVNDREFHTHSHRHTVVHYLRGARFFRLTHALEEVQFTVAFHRSLRDCLWSGNNIIGRGSLFLRRRVCTIFAFDRFQLES